MDFKSGAIIQRDYRNITHDDRDNFLGTAFQRPEIIIPNRVGFTMHFQRSTPRCGAHSGAHLKQDLDLADTGLNNYAPDFLQKAIKAIDNFNPNQGTSIEYIFKALMSKGVCDYVLLPTDFTNTEDYVAYTKPTQLQLDNAQPRIIKAYAITYNPTHDKIRDIIAQDKYAIGLLRFDRNWFSGAVHETNGELTYGHFVEFDGYDPNYVDCKDSADAINPFKRIGRKFNVTAIGSAIDISDEEVRRLVKQREILQKVVELYRQISKLKTK